MKKLREVIKEAKKLTMSIVLDMGDDITALKDAVKNKDDRRVQVIFTNLKKKINKI